jgi:hypothetical protein
VATGAPVQILAAQLGFDNEFEVTGGHPANAFACLRRADATAAQIRDDQLLHADAVVHVASPTAERVEQFCTGAVRLVGAAAQVRLLRGVVRPTNFTGGAMHDFAYAVQRQQETGPDMPHAFIVPMSKTPAWWAKSWMERHTYFLPRYDEHGHMLNEGHALTAAPGIPHLMRRTYKHAAEPAPDGAYDFVNYFECSDEDVPVFHSVAPRYATSQETPSGALSAKARRGTDTA